MKTRILLPLLLLSAAVVTPVYANWFHNPYEGINRNVGSAPNPTPADVRQDRLPIAVKNETNTDVASATPVTPANTPAKSDQASTPSGAARTVAQSSPSR